MIPPNERSSSYLFTDSAISFIKKFIAASNGVEVYFLGYQQPNGLVNEVQVLAVGNYSSLPFNDNNYGLGVIHIHNHPPDPPCFGYKSLQFNLTPSTGDIRCAGDCAKLGTGFVIIDNDCSMVRVVVESKAPSVQAINYYNRIVKGEDMKGFDPFIGKIIREFYEIAPCTLEGIMKDFTQVKGLVNV